MNLPQLVVQHKASLDRLYKRCDETFDDAFDKAFKELDNYLEAHNLSLATVAQIRDYGKPEIEENFLELA